MSFENRILYIPAGSLGFGAIGAGFAVLGVPFTEDIATLRVVNGSSHALQFSFDGVTVHFLVNAGSQWDASAGLMSNPRSRFRIGTQLYVAHLGVAPTSGIVSYNGAYLG